MLVLTCWVFVKQTGRLLHEYRQIFGHIAEEPKCSMLGMFNAAEWGLKEKLYSCLGMPGQKP